MTAPSPTSLRPPSWKGSWDRGSGTVSTSGWCAGQERTGSPKLGGAAVGGPVGEDRLPKVWGMQPWGPCCPGAREVE